MFAPITYYVDLNYDSKYLPAFCKKISSVKTYGKHKIQNHFIKLCISFCKNYRLLYMINNFLQHDRDVSNIHIIKKTAMYLDWRFPYYFVLSLSRFAAFKNFTINYYAWSRSEWHDLDARILDQIKAQCITSHKNEDGERHFFFRDFFKESNRVIFNDCLP